VDFVAIAEDDAGKPVEIGLTAFPEGVPGGIPLLELEDRGFSHL
jgi:hypothetical protein